MHSCAHVHFGVFGATFVRLLGDACVTVVSTARSLVSWGEGENGVSSPGPLMNLFMVAPATRDWTLILESSTRISRIPHWRGCIRSLLREAPHDLTPFDLSVTVSYPYLLPARIELR